MTEQLPAPDPDQPTARDEAYGPRTALVVVDVQNDFADPAGSLHVGGGEQVVGEVNARVERALAAGSPVFYTQDWHPPVTPHFAPQGGPWPVHCVRDSWGARFHPGLRVEGPSVHKGAGGEDGYSGFTSRDPGSGETSATGLVDLVRGASVAEVVVVGLAADFCVRATALDARGLGLDAVLPLAATRFVDTSPEAVRGVLDELRGAGVRLVGGPVAG